MFGDDDTGSCSYIFFFAVCPAASDSEQHTDKLIKYSRGVRERNLRRHEHLAIIYRSVVSVSCEVERKVGDAQCAVRILASPKVK